MRNRKQKDTTDPVDRLGDTWQRARLHARRVRGQLDDALAGGDPESIAGARARLADAATWESKASRRYFQAVKLGFAWWTHPGLVDQGEAENAAA